MSVPLEFLSQGGGQERGGHGGEAAGTECRDTEGGQETDPTRAGPAGLGLRVLYLSIASLLLRVKMPPNLYPLNQGSQCRPGTTVGPSKVAYGHGLQSLKLAGLEHQEKHRKCEKGS